MGSFYPKEIEEKEKEKMITTRDISPFLKGVKSRFGKSNMAKQILKFKKISAPRIGKIGNIKMRKINVPSHSLKVPKLKGIKI